MYEASVEIVSSGKIDSRMGRSAMPDETEEFFPLATMYENKPRLPAGLRPFYHVVVRSEEELKRVSSIQPDYVDAEYTLGPLSP